MIETTAAITCRCRQLAGRKKTVLTHLAEPGISDVRRQKLEGVLRRINNESWQLGCEMVGSIPDHLTGAERKAFLHRQIERKATVCAGKTRKGTKLNKRQRGVRLPIEFALESIPTNAVPSVDPFAAKLARAASAKAIADERRYANWGLTAEEEDELSFSELPSEEDSIEILFGNDSDDDSEALDPVDDIELGVCAGG